MYNSSLKNIGILTIFNLKNTRKYLLGWIIIIFAMMMMYMGMYDGMQDMARMKMEGMSENFLNLFGMEDLNQMSTYNGYTEMMYGFMIIPITIFAVVYAGNLVGKEESSKSIEFLYSLNISRTEIFTSKVVATLIGITLVIVSGGIAVILGGEMASEGYEMGRAIRVIFLSGFTAYFMAGVTLLLGGISGRYPLGTAGSMVVIASYFLGYMTRLKGDIEWLTYTSPFILFDPTKVGVFGDEIMRNLIIYGAGCLAMILLGMILYRKRDFHL